jgi:ABC-type lipoprotein export system ATPase subunit
MTDTATISSTKASLIEARGLRRTFDEGRVEALRGVSFVINEGEFVAIQGPSGSGKSTLLQMLGALDAPTDGEMLFRGKSLDLRGDMTTFRARTVGFIFQSFHLLPTLSAIENVQIPMFEMAWSMQERRERAKSLLDAVGLGDRLDHLPPKLSGGERQRVAIARSLANEPSLLLADEPTGNLDSVNADKILELLENIHQERGMTLIVVTHDAVVSSHAQRVLQMKDGKIVSDGRPTRPKE